MSGTARLIFPGASPHPSLKELSLRRHSGSEIDFGAVVVAMRLDTGLAMKVGGVVLAERLDLGKLQEGMEFPIEGSEPADSLWVVGEPGRTLLAGVRRLRVG